MSDLVTPTTADPRPRFYAACTTCGWQVQASLYASAGVLADDHAVGCPDAATEVDRVLYIGGGRRA